ncbi:hypothetical protein AB0D27_07305 [Streptomyces sp. NPDC048415]|uniref:hypothetical protein n=1 Tax=Streptomyces sp. NPDC048415 TaxID=3154822 RepID=UPI00341C137A
MTTPGPGSNETPEEPDATPEEVWLKFLTDSEPAIRTSAPREPSAQERAPGWPTRPLKADATVRQAPLPRDPIGAVGELWHPDDPWAGPSWRAMGTRARFRRGVRVIATATAITLALLAWSQLSTRADTPHDGPGDTVQQLDEAPADLPTATHLPPGFASAGPS